MNLRYQSAAIILAAGASSRMGRPKPLLQLDGETFLDRLIQRFSGICGPVIVVLGYHAGEVRAGIARRAEAQIVVNPAPEEGMLSSLQCGLRAVPDDVRSVLFTPADLPCIARQTIKRLASIDAPLAIPTFQQRKGHPVRVSREIAGELETLPLDARASDVIHRHRAHLVEVDDPGILRDVDTPGDYEALLAASGART